MSPRRLHSFYLDPEISKGLKALKQRDGVAEGESVRRALSAYLERQGITKTKTARPRATTRRRA